MSNAVLEFQGEHRFLSNFHPCQIDWLGHTYPTVEHAFQAAKFANHPDIVDEIRKAESPGRTKTIASKYRNRIEPSWFIFSRELVMYWLLKQKFSPGSQLAVRLLATGDRELIEGNRWGDTFWGVCNGVGENNLGQILMCIRSELIARSMK